MTHRHSLLIVTRLMPLWLALCFDANAEWRTVSSSKPMPLGSGAWQVTRNLGGTHDGELKLVFFDAARCTLQVVDQPAHKDAQSLDDAVRMTTALAAANGGYFTPEFTPLGLQIASGQHTGTFENSPLLTGVVVVRRSKSYLLWRNEYSVLPGISDVLQAGPRLVNDGKPVAGLDLLKARARTFIMCDNSGHWALGICRNATLASLATILTAPKVITEFKVERALNLDGGSSTGIWWRDTGGTEHYDRERATVRNFLAVVPRK